MNAFGLSGILLGFVSIPMFLVLIIKGRENKANFIWAFYVLCLTIWGFGGAKISTIKNVSSAFLWWQLTYIAIIFIPVSFLHFVCTFLEIKRKYIIIVTYVIAFVFLFFNLFSKKLFIGNVKFLFSQFYWVNPSRTATSCVYIFIYNNFNCV